jgi:hypothetical protein
VGLRTGLRQSVSLLRRFVAAEAPQQGQGGGATSIDHGEGFGAMADGGSHQETEVMSICHQIYQALMTPWQEALGKV